MRCAPTHVDPRARLLSRMRKTIFGIQAASYTRGETLERRNYTRARARMWACVRAGTRTRPAFDCILRIYSGRRVYARRTRFAFSFFFFSSSLFLFSLFSLFPFRTHAARIRTRYRANSTTRLNVYRLINAEWYIYIPEFINSGIYALRWHASIFDVDQRDPVETRREQAKMCENSKCSKG